MENAKTTKKNSPDISRDMNTKESAVTPTTALRKAWSWNAQRVLLFRGRFNPRQKAGAVVSMNTAVANGIKLKVKERYFPRAVKAAGATLLDIHVHHFTPNDGVSGVAVLAESHISVHTWPERGYAALDIFVCGACDPYAAVPVMRNAWRPEEVIISEHRRGLAE